MPSAKIGISFPDELVEEIDKISRGFKKSRSEVIRDAVTKMINDYKKLKATEKAEKIYKKIAADDKRLADDFLNICSESVAAYGNAGKKEKKK